MSGPMQLRQDGTWVPALTAGSTAPKIAGFDDEFNQTLEFASPPPGFPRAQPQPIPARATEPVPASKSKPLKTTNVLALAKARLKDVNKELRRMKALEKERAELERLIAAAQTKPKAVVAAIKSARTAG
jgi:hypothetical protein